MNHIYIFRFSIVDYKKGKGYLLTLFLLVVVKQEKWKTKDGISTEPIFIFFILQIRKEFGYYEWYFYFSSFLLQIR